jgi:hypothetical protein
MLAFHRRENSHGKLLGCQVRPETRSDAVRRRHAPSRLIWRIWPPKQPPHQTKIEVGIFGAAPPSVALIIPLVPFVVLGYRLENAGHTDSSLYQSLSCPR